MALLSAHWRPARTSTQGRKTDEALALLYILPRFPHTKNKNPAAMKKKKCIPVTPLCLTYARSREKKKKRLIVTLHLAGEQKGAQPPLPVKIAQRYSQYYKTGLMGCHVKKKELEKRTSESEERLLFTLVRSKKNNMNQCKMSRRT